MIKSHFHWGMSIVDINRAIKIINSPLEASSPEEEIKAYKTFFKEFNVDIQNENGEYKSLYDIFKEAVV